MKTIKTDFNSKGVRCDGDLFLPEGVKQPPVVIMAHGLAAQKNFGLMPYVERFVKKNIAVLLFDYRTFGKSDGTPRQVVDPSCHIEDLKAAIAHVRTMNELDSSRIALWGTSLGGGHVIATAADDKDISAVIAQVPYISGISSMKLKSLSDILKSTVYGCYDTFRSALGLSPHYSPVIAHPGTFASMNSAESYDGYMSLVGDDSIWENKLASRSFMKMAFYNPAGKAKKVKAPVLIFAAKNDSLIPVDDTIKLAGKIRKSELVVMDSSHFGTYSGDNFIKYIDSHIDFLARHLLRLML